MKKFLLKIWDYLFNIKTVIGRDYGSDDKTAILIMKRNKRTGIITVIDEKYE